MAAWDPFAVLWLPHDASLSSGQVLRAYLRRMNIMYRTVQDPQRWPAEADRIRRCAWALRTRCQRRQVLADLAVQRGQLAGLGYDPERAALAGALLTALQRHRARRGVRPPGPGAGSGTDATRMPGRRPPTVATIIPTAPSLTTNSYPEGRMSRYVLPSGAAAGWPTQNRLT